MSVEDAYIAADCPGAHRDAALHCIRRLARQLRQQQRDTPPAVAQSAGTGSGNKRKGLGSTTSTPGASKQRVSIDGASPAPVTPSSAAAAATPSPTSAAPAAAQRIKKYRTPAQVDADVKNQAVCDADYRRRFKSATRTYARYVQEGTAGQRGYSAESVAVAVNQDMLKGAREVRGATIREAVADGKQDVSPPERRGPKRKLPDELLKCAATFAELSQLNASEKSGKKLWGKLTAAVGNTPFASYASNPRQARTHLSAARLSAQG